MAFVFQLSEQCRQMVMIQVVQESSWWSEYSSLPTLNATTQKQPPFHTVSALFIPLLASITLSTAFETVFLDLFFSSHLTHLSPASESTTAKLYTLPVAFITLMISVSSVFYFSWWCFLNLASPFLSSTSPSCPRSFILKATLAVADVHIYTVFSL